MQIFKIALRNTSRQVRRTGLLAGAIGIGAMIILLLNSFTNGLIDNVKENTAQSLAGHIYVTATEVTNSGLEVARVTDDSLIIEAIEYSGIEYISVSHRTTLNETLSFGSKTTEQKVAGINPDEEQLLLDSLITINGSIDSFLTDDHSIILSEQLADSIRAVAGDEILVRLTTQTGQNNLGEFTIAAILPDEGAFSSDRAYAHLPYVNELVNMPADASETINITLADMDNTAEASMRFVAAFEKTTEIMDVEEQVEAAINSDGATSAMIGAMSESLGEETNSDGGSGTSIAIGSRMMTGRGMFGSGAIRSELPPGTVTYKLNTIDDYIGAISQLVSTLNYIGYGVFAVLLVITMVGITNTYRMMMLERIKEIGTMRAIGVQKKQVRNIFLYEAGFTAFAGAVVGLVVSLILMLLAGLIPISSAGNLTMLLNAGHLSFNISPAVTAGLFIIIVGFSMLAASNPAKKAAKIAPAEALRSTK